LESTSSPPPQKLLFSATLTQDPEKLQQLGLFQPKLFTSVVGDDQLGDVGEYKLLL
jgi:ATP-dependent RNA helicase DDX51/DBP6